MKKYEFIPSIFQQLIFLLVRQEFDAADEFILTKNIDIKRYGGYILYKIRSNACFETILRFMLMYDVDVTVVGDTFDSNILIEGPLLHHLLYNKDYTKASILVNVMEELNLPSSDIRFSDYLRRYEDILIQNMPTGRCFPATSVNLTPESMWFNDTQYRIIAKPREIKSKTQIFRDTIKNMIKEDPSISHELDSILIGGASAFL